MVLLLTYCPKIRQISRRPLVRDWGPGTESDEHQVDGRDKCNEAQQKPWSPRIWLASIIFGSWHQ